MPDEIYQSREAAKFLKSLEYKPVGRIPKRLPKPPKSLPGQMGLFDPPKPTEPPPANSSEGKP